MEKIVEYLTRAANELGVTIAAPFYHELSDGKKVVAVAHFPELGGVNGTLVFRSNQLDADVFGPLQNQGFACSSFDDPLESEEYDLEVYRELFLDWSWTSTTKEPPAWMMPEKSVHVTPNCEASFGRESFPDPAAQFSTDRKGQ